MPPSRIARRLTVFFPITWCLSSRAIPRTAPELSALRVPDPSHLHQITIPPLGHQPTAPARPAPAPLLGPRRRPSVGFPQHPRRPRPATIRQYTHDIPSIDRSPYRLMGHTSADTIRTSHHRGPRPYRLTEHTRARHPACTYRLTGHSSPPGHRGPVAAAAALRPDPSDPLHLPINRAYRPAT